MNDQHSVPVLALQAITRTYTQGAKVLQVFNGLDLAVMPGEIVAMIGPSGSGKSSLLHIAGLLEAPTSGAVFINGIECGVLKDRAKTTIRRDEIGFVYQFHHLLPEFNALENVMMPLLIAGKSRARAYERAEDLLLRLNLQERLAHRPAELSGGEQQRVAIARALANHPRLLLADEPTGNLDPETAERVHQTFLELIASEGVGALIATHNTGLAHRMGRVINLDKGRLVEAGS